jgi:hypothetical protein
MERIDTALTLAAGSVGLIVGYLLRRLEKKKEIEISLKSRLYPALVALIYHHKHCSEYFQEAIITKEETINELQTIRMRLDKLIYEEGLVGLIDDKRARELLFNFHSDLGAIILKMKNLDEEILRKKFKKGEDLSTRSGPERPLNQATLVHETSELLNYVEKRM